MSETLARACTSFVSLKFLFFSSMGSVISNKFVDQVRNVEQRKNCKLVKVQEDTGVNLCPYNIK